MPTPVSSAKQCLTPESSTALDAAVVVARRRGHAQTTSLHAVSALLSLPSSTLKDACLRARNSAYSSRLQFKALELSLNVSLDRISVSPRSSPEEEPPPVSNSFMAAIKRSQANQRRQPESFQVFQRQFIQPQIPSTVSIVKVELQNLILSILDDPVVSRVFGEAGFRSCDIKLSIIRPVSHMLRYSRTRVPPLFLCNLSENSDPGHRSFSFPFYGANGFSYGDENCRRIGEILVRKKGKNPILVGVCGYYAMNSLFEVIERKRVGVLPTELSGVCLISMENDVSEFVSENCTNGSMNSRFEEVEKALEHCLGPGLILNLGDLKAFVVGNGVSMSYVIARLTRLLVTHSGKLWLMGSAESYELYLKFLSAFPSIEKDWDLQLLPITSFKPSMGESYPKSSLMESFVPFGGLFPTPSDLKGPLNMSYRCFSRCDACNEKYEQEVNDVTKAKDDGLVLNAKVTALQKKWDNICQRLHHTKPLPQSDNRESGFHVSPIVGFQFAKSKNESTDDHSSNYTNSSLNNSGSENVKQTTLNPKSNTESSLSKLFDNSTSATSATSVTTDLGLGMYSPATKNPDFKTLFRSLTEKLGRQNEATSVITETLTQCRVGNGKRRGSSPKRDIWFNFLGPDRFGKKKIALSLAELLYGSRESCVCLDLNSQNGSSFGQEMEDYDVKFRGKTVVDYIFGELNKKTLSVFFLENVDKADLLAQQCLSKAIKTGKFSDSHGREIGIGNTIFITTSTMTNGRKISESENEFGYSEEKVLSAKGWPLKILVGGESNSPRKDTQNPLFMNKRKLFGTKGKSDIVKRTHKGLTMDLDLNLPAEEFEVDCDWLDEFFTHMDEVVTFKPFDFDSLAENVSQKINESFKKHVGSDCFLKIDSKVMVQLLAASYVSDGNNKVVENWVDHVLSNGFIEARNSYDLSARTVVKLVACDGVLMEEKAPRIYLPAKIIMN